MKKFLTILATASALAITPAVMAGEKETEVKGTATCAKCDLGTASKCTDVIKIAGEDDYILLTGPGAKGFHKNICKGSEKVKAKGKKEDDKFVATEIIILD